MAARAIQQDSLDQIGAVVGVVDFVPVVEDKHEVLLERRNLAQQRRGKRFKGAARAAVQQGVRRGQGIREALPDRRHDISQKRPPIGIEAVEAIPAYRQGRAGRPIDQQRCFTVPGRRRQRHQALMGYVADILG